MGALAIEHTMPLGRRTCRYRPSKRRLMRALPNKQKNPERFGRLRSDRLKEKRLTGGQAGQPQKTLSRANPLHSLGGKRKELTVS